MSDEQPEDERVVYLSLRQALICWAAAMQDSVEAAQRYLRDEAALEGALARPGFRAHYENASLAEQAAVLCHGIVQSHPFVDGNKRCATVALLTFLRLNGVDLGVDDDVLFAWMLDIAQGGTSAVLAERIAGALRPIDGPFG